MVTVFFARLGKLARGHIRCYWLRNSYYKFSYQSLPVITPNFIFNGTAGVQPGNVFQLTQAVNNQSGSVWNNIMIDLNQPFSFDIDVFLGCNGGGADGSLCSSPVSTSWDQRGGLDTKYFTFIRSW